MDLEAYLLLSDTSSLSSLIKKKSKCKNETIKNHGMKKIESLSQTQVNQMKGVREYWLDKIFKKRSFDKKKAIEGINWLYNFCKLPKPIIIITDSPYSCQLAANIFAHVSDHVSDQVSDHVWDHVWNQVRANVRAHVSDHVSDHVRAHVWNHVSDHVWNQVRANVWDQVRANVRAHVSDHARAHVSDHARAHVSDQVSDHVSDHVRAHVWNQVSDHVWNQVRANVWNQVKYYESSYYVNLSDYSWISFYDFFDKQKIINNSDFHRFRDLIDSGVFDMIQLRGVCFVSKMPNIINRNSNLRLHCENGPAIQFEDGCKLYFWDGMSVNENWILNPETINKNDILKETNAEKRRALREILGAKKYYDIISDGKGLRLIDEDLDNQGHSMKLYQTIINDEIINKKVQFLEVVDPSTERVYNIYPPQQDSENVWEAKSDTFNNEKIKYRHGDCGLLDINRKYEKPILET